MSMCRLLFLGEAALSALILIWKSIDLKINVNRANHQNIKIENKYFLQLGFRRPLSLDGING